MDSVRAQMVADVPIGTLLSGGVDSSVIIFEYHELDRQIEIVSMAFEAEEYGEKVADRGLS